MVHQGRIGLRRFIYYFTTGLVLVCILSKSYTRKRGRVADSAMNRLIYNAPSVLLQLS